MAQKDILENAFVSNLCQGIRHMFTDGCLCDMAVEVGKSTFSCHSVVMAAISGYFRVNTGAGNPVGYLCIHDDRVSAESFSKILDIVYKGSNPVDSVETAMSLLKSATFLQISFLQEHCERFLLDHLDTDTCLEVWQFADTHDLFSLGEKSKEIACSNFDDIQESLSFLNLPRQLLLNLLSSPDLSLERGDAWLDSVIKWVKHDEDRRKVHLAEFLPYVSFCDISEDFIYEEIFRDSVWQQEEVLDYFYEQMTLRQESRSKLNSKLRNRLFMHQDIIPSAGGMEHVLVLLGGTIGHMTQLPFISAFTIDCNLLSVTSNTLQAIPVNHGPGFSSCKWRNELYVSGGSLAPTGFAVYNSGINEWSVLPEMIRGRAKHCMEAVNWNVYVLGGMEPGSAIENEILPHQSPTADVLAYNVKVKTWSTVAALAMAVFDATSSVIGRKIYVIGGLGFDGNATALVQCVDTQTGCVSTAGQLPSPGYGARAVRNAGANYVVTCEGEVFEMKERLHYTERRMKLSGCCTEDVQKSGYKENENVTRSNLQDVRHQLPAAGDVKIKEGFSHLREDMALTETKACAINVFSESDDSLISGVRFHQVATIARRRHFGLFIDDFDVVICGGHDEDENLMTGVERVNVKSRKVTTIEKQFIQMDLILKTHLLNIPTLTERTDFLFTFHPESLQFGRAIHSLEVRHGMFDWFISVRNNSGQRVRNNSGLTVRNNSGQYLSVLLHKAKSDETRNWKVNVQYSFWIVPMRPDCKEIYQEADATFVDPSSLEHGFLSFIAFRDLKDKYMRDGEVTIHTCISIKSPPRPE